MFSFLQVSLPQLEMWVPVVSKVDITLRLHSHNNVVKIRTYFLSPLFNQGCVALRVKL